MNVRVKGVRQTLVNTKAVMGALGAEIGAAAKVVGDMVFGQAKGMVPYESGRLLRSGRIRIKKSRKKPGVVITFGGARAPYANIVHEDLSARHPQGRAKFLEIPYLRAIPFFHVQIRTRISKKLKARG